MRMLIWSLQCLLSGLAIRYILLNWAEKTVQRHEERDQEEIMSSLEELKLAVSDFLQFTNSSLRDYLQYRCDTFTAGCIAHSLPAWCNITSDNEILSTVMAMKIVFNATPCQKFLPTCTRSITETTIINLEIQRLLSKHVIEPTGHCHKEIISDVFVRGKKDGSHRMILNLKNLNQYANKIHFKMDTLNTITKLVQQDCFMASIDLKDAYYSTPIATSDRKYLKFSWKGNFISLHVCQMVFHVGLGNSLNFENSGTNKNRF